MLEISTTQDFLGVQDTRRVLLYPLSPPFCRRLLDCHRNESAPPEITCCSISGKLPWGLRYNFQSLPDGDLPTLKPPKCFFGMLAFCIYGRFGTGLYKESLSSFSPLHAENQLSYPDLFFCHYISDYFQSPPPISSYANYLTAAAYLSDYRTATVLANHASEAGWARSKSMFKSLHSPS